jgi:hypothetical protein
MSLIAERLDQVAQAFTKIRFRPWECGSGGDGVAFDVTRRNHALRFIYREVEVTVGDFKLIDEKDWAKREPTAPPAVDHSRSIRRYFYEAEVSFAVDGIKGKGRVMLGWLPRIDSMLGPLGTMPERRLIGDLLGAIENQLASSYDDEFLEKQVRKYPEAERCHNHKEDHGVKRIVRWLGLS